VADYADGMGAYALLKPWNFFDETPTLGKKKDEQK
jgi:primary-amine oxidase